MHIDQPTHSLIGKNRDLQRVTVPYAKIVDMEGFGVDAEGMVS